MWRLRRALTEAPAVRATRAAGPIELEQQRARGHVLGTARSVALIPERTQLAAQPCAVPLGMRLDDPQIPSISEVLSFRPCMIMTLAMAAK